MNDFMLNMALQHFNFDETQSARIRAAIPKAAYLAQLVKSHKSVINEMIDVAEMITSQIAKQENA